MPLGGWTKVMELLALAVEEVALIAADRRREEPTTIIRPQLPGAEAPRNAPSAPRPPQPEPKQPAPRMTGHRQMLMAAMQRGMIRSG
ncbi:hypothetical protein [Streptomyces anulatus]|uniref:hypothetical protein n=1 Tax=Streptomyces anulatus TaxID=1892 RepID=UPI0036697A65